MLKLKNLSGNILLIVLFVIPALAALGYILLLPSYLNHKHVLASKDAQEATPASALSTPSPSASPSPSPEVLTGYCLNVPILMYHHIQPQEIAKKKGQTAFTVNTDIFDSQMSYVKSAGYTSISTSQLVQALINHTATPKKSIVITLDDAYQDSYYNALPILQKYQLHADFLIPTGLLNNPDYLTGDQLKATLSSGLVSTINHTYSHSNIAILSPDKLSFEVLTAKKQLADFGQNPNIFGYPYGTVAAIKFLQDNGYIAALSTIPGQTQCDSFLMSLHRTRVGNSSLSSYGI